MKRLACAGQRTILLHPGSALLAAHLSQMDRALDVAFFYQALSVGRLAGILCSTRVGKMASSKTASSAVHDYLPICHIAQVASGEHASSRSSSPNPPARGPRRGGLSFYQGTTVGRPPGRRRHRLGDAQRGIYGGEKNTVVRRSQAGEHDVG